MGDSMLIGTPWTELAGVTATGGNTVSAALGVDRVLHRSPGKFARFENNAPGKTYVELNLGKQYSVRQLMAIGNLRAGDDVRFRLGTAAISDPTEVAPSVLDTQTNLTGTVSVLADDPDDYATDSQWLTATAARTDGEMLVTFPGQSSLLTGTGSQEIRFSIRRDTDDEDADTSLVVQVKQGVWTHNHTPTEVLGKADDPRVISVKFDAADIPSPTAAIQLRVASATSSVDGTGPAMEIGAVRWIAAPSHVGHDSGYISAPVADSSSLWSGSAARDAIQAELYYDVGSNYDAQYVRMDFRRGRSMELVELGALLPASGYTPSVSPNVTRTGALAGYAGIPAATVGPGGQRFHGSVQEPPRTLQIDLRAVPEAEAEELHWRLLSRGYGRLVCSVKPSDPKETNTIYGEMLASGNATPIKKSLKPGHMDVSFTLVQVK